MGGVDVDAPGGAVCGGRSNVASGTYSTVGGGNGHTASGIDDWVAGSLFQDQ
jgi:hypothetical protein